MPGQDGVYRVRVVVTDIDDLSAVQEVVLTIANVAPQLSAPAAQNALEGKAAAFSLGSFTDPGVDSPWRVTVAWGDGVSASFDAAMPGSLGTRTHAYDDNGAYTVTVTVSDGLATGTTTFAVVVANQAPAGKLVVPSAVAEGAGFTVALAQLDDASAADLAVPLAIYFAADGAIASVAGDLVGSEARATFTFPDGPSDHVIRARVVDKDGGFSEYTRIVHVDNVAPENVSAGAHRTVFEGEHVTLSGMFTDPAGAPHDYPDRG